MGVKGRGLSWGRRLNMKPESAVLFGEVVHFIHHYNGTVEQSILEAVRRFEHSRTGFRCAETSCRNRVRRCLLAGRPSFPGGGR